MGKVSDPSILVQNLLSEFGLRTFVIVSLVLLALSDICKLIFQGFHHIEGFQRWHIICVIRIGVEIFEVVEVLLQIFFNSLLVSVFLKMLQTMHTQHFVSLDIAFFDGLFSFI